MPFTVSCAACNSRFLLGDDLFRRKVSGKVVTVKCRSCSAEISVDATEPDTLPSQDLPPRPRPAPPRPKHKAGDAATATPMPVTATPKPATAHASDSLSIWDAEEKKPAPAARKPPPPRAPDRDFIDEIEEAPPSSSDAPSLNSLTHESPKQRKTGKKAPDDFLMNLSAGSAGILGAPTIDVTGMGSPPPPAVEELLEVEATELTPHAGTVPLFDMSAVLPVASTARAAHAPNLSSLSPSHVDLEIDVDVDVPEPANSAAKARERRHVIAPLSRENPTRRRSSGALWFALVAAAAGIVAIVGLRGHSAPPHTPPDPEPAAHPPVPAEVAAVVDPTATLSAITTSEVTQAASAAAPEAPLTAKAPPTTATAATGSSSTPNSPSPAKIAEAASPAAEEKPKPGSAEAAEKPVLPEKPTLEAPKPTPQPAEPGTEFDRSAAVAALKAAAGEAAACRKDGDPSGTASLTITFAPSGRVTSANIQGPPFAGTPTGGCIANAMRRAHVPAFSGDRVTVSKTIVIQ